MQNIISNLKSRQLRWAGYVEHMEQSRNAYRVLVGKPEGKRPSGRTRRRWEDNIKMDLRKVGCVPGDWIARVEDRDQCTVGQNLNPYSAKSLGDRLYATLHKMPGEIGNSFCLFLKS